MPDANILDDLQARGLVHDSTDRNQLRERLEQPITLYAGFDPTADSLHVGNLLPLLLLRRFQLLGHRPIALAGGATGMIGDPSFRADERHLLDQATLDANIAAIRDQLSSFLELHDGENAAVLVDNRDWTEPIGVLDFLRDVGKHLTISQMLAKESVRARVDSEIGLSFTEFSYMLLQANDFRWLFENEGCELQVGGSDQWGNITAGIDLVHKSLGAQVFGLTVPLMTRSDGAKFGKTAAGAVWLDPAKSSPYELYQYFVNVADTDVERFLLQLTLLDVAEALAVAEDHSRSPERRAGQSRLAAEVVGLVHGAGAAAEAEAASAEFSTSTASLSSARLASLAGEIPTAEIRRDLLFGADVVDVLVDVGLAKSKSDARRTIDQGGMYLNDDKIVGPDFTIPASAELDGGYLMLRRGKRNRCLVVVT